MYTCKKYKIKKKELPENLKQWTPHDTHLRTTKKAVSETQNHSNANTHHTTINILNIKKGKTDQSKHTPGNRNNNPYINQFDQARVIYTGNKSEIKPYWVPL